MRNNFKIQLKISEASLSELKQSYSEQELLWMDVKEMIKANKAELSVIEQDNEYKRFPIPEEIENRNEKWDKSKITAIFIEPDSLFILSKKAIKDKDKVLMKVLKVIDVYDCVLYSYYHKNALYLGVTWLVNDFSSCCELSNEMW